MISDVIWSLAVTLGFIIIFGILFASLNYVEKLKVECRMSAMQKGYTAVEIQAVCK